MFDKYKIQEKLTEFRLKQFAIQQRPYSAFDAQLDDFMLDIFLDAAQAGEMQNMDVIMRALPFATGTGKSTTASAVIAAFAVCCPQFSVLLAAPTARVAVQIQGYIEELLGDMSTYLYTHYHDAENFDPAEAEAKLGFVPTRLTTKAGLSHARIVIVTHSLLERDLDGRSQVGLMTYNGKQRTVTVFDEQPNFRTALSVTHDEVVDLYEALVTEHPEHKLATVLPDLCSSMLQHQQGKGQRFVIADYLDEEKRQFLQHGVDVDMWKLTDRRASRAKRQQQLEAFENTVKFLHLCAGRDTFYDRRRKTFQCPYLPLDESYPSYILLDATCHIANLVTQHSKVQVRNVPQVSYELLEMSLLSMPDEFNDVGKIKSDPSLRHRLVEFMYGSTLANTKPGNKVLVQGPKSAIEHLAALMGDGTGKYNWNGRLVDLLHYGSGVGSNEYRDKEIVIQLCDFHRPNSANVSEVHAWSGDKMSDEVLLGAEARKTMGGIAIPKGKYGLRSEGHLLSNAVQMGMRGSARNIQADGKCSPMKIITTMAPARLIPNLQKMYPGINSPEIANQPDGSHMLIPKGRAGLLLLLSTTKEKQLSAAHIEGITGIAKSKMVREFKACQKLLAGYAWEVRSASDLGFGGNTKYLCQP